MLFHLDILQNKSIEINRRKEIEYLELNQRDSEIKLPDKEIEEKLIH